MATDYGIDEEEEVSTDAEEENPFARFGTVTEELPPQESQPEENPFRQFHQPSPDAQVGLKAIERALQLADLARVATATVGVPQIPDERKAGLEAIDKALKLSELAQRSTQTVGVPSLPDPNLLSGAIKGIPGALATAGQAFLSPLEAAGVSMFGQQKDILGLPFGPTTPAHETLFNPLFVPPPEEKGIIPSLGRGLAGLATPGNLGAMMAAPFAPQAVLGGFISQVPEGISQGIEELKQAKTGPETQGAITDLALTIGMGELMRRGLIKGRGKNALQPKDSQLHGGMRPRDEAQQVGTEVPTEISGQEAGVGRSKALSQEAQVLLDAPGIKYSFGSNGEGNPAQANLRTGEIVIDAHEFNQWVEKDLAGLSPEMKARRIRGMFNEEGIHLQTPPEEAIPFLESMTDFERWVLDKYYLKGRARDTQQNMGMEAIRNRVERAMKLDRNDFLHLVGTEKWTAHTLDYLANMYGRIRRFRTGLNAEQKRILDHVIGNFEAAREMQKLVPPVKLQDLTDEEKAELQKSFDEVNADVEDKPASTGKYGAPPEETTLKQNIARREALLADPEALSKAAEGTGLTLEQYSDLLKKNNKDNAARLAELGGKTMDEVNAEMAEAPPPEDIPESAGPPTRTISRVQPVETSAIGNEMRYSEALRILKDDPDLNTDPDKQRLYSELKSQLEHEKRRKYPSMKREVDKLTHDELMDMDDSKAVEFFKGLRSKGSAPQKDGVEYGLGLDESDVPKLTQLRDQAHRSLMEKVQKGDPDAGEADMGRVVWLNGAIEGAKREGPNYERHGTRPRILLPERLREMAGMVQRGEPIPADVIHEFNLKVPPGYELEGKVYRKTGEGPSMKRTTDDIHKDINETREKINDLYGEVEKKFPALKGYFQRRDQLVDQGMSYKDATYESKLGMRMKLFLSDEEMGQLHELDQARHLRYKLDDLKQELASGEEYFPSMKRKETKSIRELREERERAIDALVAAKTPQEIEKAELHLSAINGRLDDAINDFIPRDHPDYAAFKKTFKALAEEFRKPEDESMSFPSMKRRQTKEELQAKLDALKAAAASGQEMPRLGPGAKAPIQPTYEPVPPQERLGAVEAGAFPGTSGPRRIAPNVEGPVTPDKTKFFTNEFLETTAKAIPEVGIREGRLAGVKMDVPYVAGDPKFGFDSFKEQFQTRFGPTPEGAMRETYKNGLMTFLFHAKGATLQKLIRSLNLSGRFAGRGKMPGEVIPTAATRIADPSFDAPELGPQMALELEGKTVPQKAKHLEKAVKRAQDAIKLEYEYTLARNQLRGIRNELRDLGVSDVTSRGDPLDMNRKRIKAPSMEVRSKANRAADIQRKMDEMLDPDKEAREKLVEIGSAHKKPTTARLQQMKEEEGMMLRSAFEPRPPPRTKLFNRAQQRRFHIIATIYDELAKKADVGKKSATRSEVIPDDIGSQMKAKEPVFFSISNRELQRPNDLAQRLVQDSRTFTGKVSLTHRLVAMVSKESGRVELVDVYLDPRRGPVGMSTVGTGVHQPLETLFKTHRPIYSVYLDEPVTNFRQKFGSVREFEEKFGKQAAQQASGAEFGFPGSEGKKTGQVLTSEMKADRYLRMQGKRGSLEKELEGRLREDQSQAVYDAIFNEVRQLEDPQEVLDTLNAIHDRAHEGEKINRMNLKAIAGFNKIFEHLKRKYPMADDQTIMEMLSKSIYENYKTARSYEDLSKRLTNRHGGQAEMAGQEGEGAGTETVQTGARELTAQPRGPIPGPEYETRRAMAVEAARRAQAGPEHAATSPIPEPAGQRAIETAARLKREAIAEAEKENFAEYLKFREKTGSKIRYRDWRARKEIGRRPPSQYKVPDIGEFKEIEPADTRAGEESVRPGELEDYIPPEEGEAGPSMKRKLSYDEWDKEASRLGKLYTEMPIGRGSEQAWEKFRDHFLAYPEYQKIWNSKEYEGEPSLGPGLGPNMKRKLTLSEWDDEASRLAGIASWKPESVAARKAQDELQKLKSDYPEYYQIRKQGYSGEPEIGPGLGPNMKRAADAARYVWDRIKTPGILDRQAIEPDFTNPLPRIPGNVNEALTRATGIERVPLVGRLWGPRANIREPSDRSVVGYAVKRNMGNSLAAINGQVLRDTQTRLRNPFQIDEDGTITNLDAVKGASKKQSDVIEAWQRQVVIPEQMMKIPGMSGADIIKYKNSNPVEYNFTKPQEAMLRSLYPYLKDGYKYIEEKNASMDPGQYKQPMLVGLGNELVVYPFPRVALGKKGVPPLLANVQRRIGGSYRIENERLYESEERGAKTTNYEPDMINRMVTFMSRVYKSVADADLANDPALKGENIKDRRERLAKEYSDVIKSGEMSLDKLEQITRKGRLSQDTRVESHPAFAGKIFPIDIANKLERAFGEQTHVGVRHLGQISRALKAFELTADLAQFTQQGLPTMILNPAAFSRAMVGSLKAFNDPNVLGKAMRDPEMANAAKEFVQHGGTLAYLQDFMSGTKPGEIAAQIPYVRQVVVRSGQSFGTFLDLAKLNLWKSMREGVPKEQMAEMVEQIENITLSGRMEAAGVHPGRALAERIVLMAPSYYRAAIQHVSAAAEGAYRLARGEGAQYRAQVEALKTFSTFIAGIHLLMYGAYKAAGMDSDEIRRRMIPGGSKYLRFPVHIGKRVIEIGPGGISLGLVDLLGKVVDTARTDPKAFLSGGSNNPFVQWGASKLGPVPSWIYEQRTGKDFSGRATTALGSTVNKLLPISAQTGIQAGQRQEPVAALVESGASFGGLKSTTRSPASDLREIVDDKLKHSPDPKEKAIWKQHRNQQDIFISDYRPLRDALVKGQLGEARREYLKLTQIKGNSNQTAEDMIKEAMDPEKGTITGLSREMEAELKDRMTRSELRTFEAAEDEKARLYRLFDRISD